MASGIPAFAAPCVVSRCGVSPAATPEAAGSSAVAPVSRSSLQTRTGAPDQAPRFVNKRSLRLSRVLLFEAALPALVVGRRLLGPLALAALVRAWLGSPVAPVRDAALIGDRARNRQGKGQRRTGHQDRKLAHHPCLHFTSPEFLRVSSWQPFRGVPPVTLSGCRSRAHA